MKQFVQIGSTSKRTVIFVQNGTSTLGAGLTGLTNSSSGLVWKWYSESSGTSSSVTIVGQTLGTWTSGGFVQVDSTNLPGFYELGIPNALLTGTTPTWVTMQLAGAANMVPVNIEIELTGFNPASGTFTSTVVGGTIAAVTGTVTATVPTLSTNVNVQQWLGTAVTSNTGTPVVFATGGTIATVTGTITATVPTTTPANILQWNGTNVAVPNIGGVPKVDITDWLGTAVTSNVGVPIVNVTAGTVTTVSGNVAGNVVGSVGSVTSTVTATVPTLSTNVNIQQWLGTAVTSNAGIPIVDVAAGTISTVTGTVTATVVGGTVATVTNPVTLTAGQLTVKKNTALNGFTFPMYNSTTGSPATGLTVACTISIDGASLVSSTNAAAEVGSGIYKLNLAAADVNGTVITLVFTATGASATIVTLITQA